jgi:sec-independent protein translocase protein TatC
MSDAQAKGDSFISHLVELRDRLVRAVLAIVIIFVCLFPWAKDIYALLAKPLLAALPRGGHLIATEVTAPFFVPVKVTMLAAFLIALPWVLYQAWAFVAPGLYEHERRLGLPIIVSAVVLFIIGMAFAYFAVFPIVFGAIVGFTPAGVEMTTDIGKYVDFVLTLFLAFGITFEVPVVVVLMVKFGWVSITKLVEIRPYVIVGAFVIGAIFTPPDIISQTLLAVPLWLLYEAGILVARFMIKPRAESAPEASPHPSDFVPMSDEEMERELDRVEAEEKSGSNLPQ